MPDDRLFAAFDWLGLALQSRAPQGSMPGVTLNVVNDAWADKRLTISPAYLNTLAVDYGTGVHVTDIAASPDAAAAVINDTVASETSQKILNIEPPGSITAETRLVLVNAAYFQASWQSPFDPESTSPRSFTRLDGSKVDVPMMIAPNPPNAASGEGYTAVELPYAGSQVSMVAIVPKQGSFKTVEAALTGEMVIGVFSSLQPSGYGLVVPKFKLSGATIDLSKQLQALGMTEAFDPNAGGFIPALVDPEGLVYIHHVFHQAFIAVDEGGTQAAAATAVQIDVDGGVSVETAIVTLDRPFFFFVRDIPTNSILFAGRVMDPTAD